MTFRPLVSSTVLAVALTLPFSALAEENADQENGPELGEAYSVATYQDWEILCTRIEVDGPELCEMYQLLLNEDDSPVAEITVASLPPEEDFPVGATVTTPLETFLLPGLGWQVGDDGEIRAEPFQVCNVVGCAAMLGFDEDEVEAMRMGSHANVLFRPFANPQHLARARVSLMGFTAALEDLADRTPVPMGATITD